MGGTTWRRSAVVDHNIIPTRENGRLDLHAETGRGGLRAGFNPASRNIIPMHRLYGCSGALHALVSLGGYGRVVAAEHPALGLFHADPSLSSHWVFCLF